MATSSNKTAPKKRGFSFAGILKYFKEVVSELRRVSWPERKDLVSYTIAVIIFVLIAGAIIGAEDLLFAQGLKLIVG